MKHTRADAASAVVHQTRGRDRDMEFARQRQIIDATIAVIGRYGLGGTTFTRIGRAAGLSAGIISYYFGDKNGLLAATMRALLTDLEADMVARLRGASSPTERIHAVLAASFSQEQFTPCVRAAWLSFYAQVPFSAPLARLHRIYLGRLHSNLRHAFRRILPAADADMAAHGMAAMIDGIWVQGAVAPGMLDIERARLLAEVHLRMTLEYRGMFAESAHASTPDFA